MTLKLYKEWLEVSDFSRLFIEKISRYAKAYFKEEEKDNLARTVQNLKEVKQKLQEKHVKILVTLKLCKEWLERSDFSRLFIEEVSKRFKGYCKEEEKDGFEDVTV